ncbi:hypothetical protein V6Z11_A02G090300 [Gossypium hirsutum]
MGNRRILALMRVGLQVPSPKRCRFEACGEGSETTSFQGLYLNQFFFKKKFISALIPLKKKTESLSTLFHPSLPRPAKRALSSPPCRSRGQWPALRERDFLAPFQVNPKGHAPQASKMRKRKSLPLPFRSNSRRRRDPRRQACGTAQVSNARGGGGWCVGYGGRGVRRLVKGARVFSSLFLLKIS